MDVATFIALFTVGVVFCFTVGYISDPESTKGWIMRTLAVGTGVCVLIAAWSVVAHAESAVSEGAAQAAEEAGLDARDVQAASQSVGVDPWTYLYGTGELARPTYGPLLAVHRVRLTYYTLSGRTYSGEQVHRGGTACSWNYAIGTRFRFPNGEIVRCNDRGYLGNDGWLDVWNRSDLARLYGAYVNVEVLW
jgi:hypothetical protein